MKIFANPKITLFLDYNPKIRTDFWIRDIFELFLPC